MVVVVVMHIVQVKVGDYPPDLQVGDIVCKRSSGWISYDNYIHTTKRKNMYLIATFRSPMANFIRHMVT